jgi:hypothetical protein
MELQRSLKHVEDPRLVVAMKRDYYSRRQGALEERLTSCPVSLGATKKFSRTPNMLKV